MHPSIYGKKLMEARTRLQESASKLGEAVALESEYLQALNVQHKDPQIVHLRTVEAVADILDQLVERALPTEPAAPKKRTTKSKKE